MFVLVFTFVLIDSLNASEKFPFIEYSLMFLTIITYVKIVNTNVDIKKSYLSIGKNVTFPSIWTAYLCC